MGGHGFCASGDAERGRNRSMVGRVGGDFTLSNTPACLGMTPAIIPLSSPQGIFNLMLMVKSPIVGGNASNADCSSKV